MDALSRVFEAGGGPTELARRLGTRQSVVSNWKSRKRIPAEWVVEVERVTGVPRAEIRPDVFGQAPPIDTKEAAA